MTENSNMPMSGIYVAAKPMPDLRWPRHKKWYTTSTWVSRATGTYLGHVAKGGRNFAATTFAQRLWHQNTPPTRVASVMAATVAWDLTTPFYMLADDLGDAASTEDTIVGPDYYNPPNDLYQDVNALSQTGRLDIASYRHMFMRVLAVNHQFTFTNNSRFPLEIYYTFLPSGYQFNTMPDQYSPHQDMDTHALKKIVVPAIRDAADRGQKKTLDIKVSIEDLFPAEYQIPPGSRMSNTTAGGSTSDGNSPWISVLADGSSSSFYRNIPPGQISDDSHSTPDFSKSGPVCGLRMHWYAKLQQPRDVGLTTEDTDHSGGDYQGNNYDVHARCSWLVETIRIGRLHLPHGGEKAYPDQT